MARIYDDKLANRIAVLWTRIEDAVLEIDECVDTEEAAELGEDWRRFKDAFDRFYDVLTEAIEP